FGESHALVFPTVVRAGTTDGGHLLSITTLTRGNTQGPIMRRRDDGGLRARSAGSAGRIGNRGTPEGPGGPSLKDKADADLVAEMHLPGSEALGALFHRYVRLVRRVAVDILRDEGE